MIKRESINIRDNHGVLYEVKRNIKRSHARD